MSEIPAPRFENGHAMLMAGLRIHHGYDEAATAIPAQWARFARLLPLPGQVGRQDYGVMCGGDVAARRFEYMTAAEVERFDGLPQELDRMKIPEAHYAVFTHVGHVSELRRTWAAVHEWLPTSGWKSAASPDFERYGPGFDPVTGLGDMEIWLPVVRP